MNLLFFRFLGLLLLNLLALSLAAAETSSDKVRSHQDFADIRKQVETLRGKKFLHEVPVFNVSPKELRAISDHDLEKDFPGSELHHYEELLTWLDMVPPGTNLKAAFGDFDAEQLAGLYDSDKKEMCIPWPTNGTNSAKNKLESVPAGTDGIVMAHEFTHALEDQYWPFDVPEDNDRKISTDRGTAHSFVAEGSASREMIEVIPAQWAGDVPGAYFLLWNILHSTAGELVLDYAMNRAWKGSDTLVEGVPETIARTEAMPYSFGYSFCTKIMREWGLDGFDYIYEHPPVSSEQVMHPTKCWVWRDFPVQIDVPDTLTGGWKQISLDSMGEAGMATLFGCQFQNLNRGLAAARGWDGDHAALFEAPDGHRLLLWASSWDSTNAAARFVNAFLREREVAHQASATKGNSDRFAWDRPDGRSGFIKRDARHVVLVETDEPEVLQDAETVIRSVTFTEPPEDAIRAAENSPLRRFNPFLSRQKDRDYTVTRSLCGLLSRHDRNSVGALDRYVLGAVGEFRRTTSFYKWEVGGGMIARHESEARRGISSTSLLPWGILASHASARLPQSPEKTITRTSVLWGLGGSISVNGEGLHSLNILPFGLLLHKTSSPNQTSFHILATGLSHKTTGNKCTTRFQVLGVRFQSRAATT